MQGNDEEFSGVIGRTYKDSKPWWSPPPAAPAAAPDVVFIVLDDVGFSDIGCYGSEIATPNMDALAEGGLRYNNFHVTSMCSPTRACLLTGRNAHAVGVGAIAEWSNGFPGYRGRISKKAATAAELLAEHAYGTYAVGKWHLTNIENYVTAGPHEHWPLGRGFSRWYGFMGGYVDHWNPDLHEDNHPVHHVPRAGYHLSEDLVDRAIGFVRDHVTSAPERPCFLYLAFGAAHWPLHVPREYIERYKGRYDAGWDEVRKARFHKQKTTGIVPSHAELAPRNPGVEPWDSLPSDTRALCARLQETYAGFMEHTDAQIGRLVEHLKAVGRFDNTMIVLLSDNGASGEGGPRGAFNIRKHMVTEKETVAEALADLHLVGSERSFPHYPAGWAQVSNTPLKWYKKNTHGGGIRAPLIVHWPNRIKLRGEIRDQYHHVNDILPTVLDVGGMHAPSVYRGVEQLPLHGISMAYTFDTAEGPSRKRQQYYEILGDRAIWAEGWKAVARHTKGEDFERDHWELYRTDGDFSETCDLAAAQPEKLEQLISLWWEDAQRYGVLPLDDRDVERLASRTASNPVSRYEFYPGMARTDRILVPVLGARNYRIEADLDLASPAAEGVVLAMGNRFAGSLLHCSGGELIFRYVYTESISSELRIALQPGLHRYAVHFVCDSEGSGGQLTLSCDGHEGARARLEKTWPTHALTAGLTCGRIDVPFDDCTAPAEFTGTIRKVAIVLEPLRGPAPALFRAILQEE